MKGKASKYRKNKSEEVDRLVSKQRSARRTTWRSRTITMANSAYYEEQDRLFSFFYLKSFKRFKNFKRVVAFVQQALSKLLFCYERMTVTGKYVSVHNIVRTLLF